MESRKDLETKLAQYQAQLEQVAGLLEVDGENPQFLKLRDDLTSVIVLTANLIQQAYTHQVAPKDNESSSAQDGGSTEQFSIKKGAAIAKTGEIVVGENVEVTGGDRLYAGTVVEIVSSEEYKIKYFEFDAIVSLPATSLLRMDVNNSLAERLQDYEVSVGFSGQCKYALDGLFYDCVVTGVTAHGYNITYTLYGNSEEVPLEYLRSTPVEAAPAGHAAPKKDKKSSDGIIPIPENLRILPTDTEEEKRRKQKKQKAIKNKNRVVTIENEVAAVQQTWQKFVTKGTKRALPGVVKSSMFASSDSLEGKLGVVNSGKGMTSFGERKKHKFEL